MARYAMGQGHDETGVGFTGAGVVVRFGVCVQTAGIAVPAIVVTAGAVEAGVLSRTTGVPSVPVGTGVGEKSPSRVSATALSIV